MTVDEEARVRTEKTGRIGHEAVTEATYVFDRTGLARNPQNSFLVSGNPSRSSRPIKYRKQNFMGHLERSEAESKFAKWSGVKWSKPTERSEGEIYEGSPIPHRGDVTSFSARAQGTVVYGDVVSHLVYRSLRITEYRYASVLLCSA